MAAQIIPNSLQDNENVSLSALVKMPEVCAQCDQPGTDAVHRLIPWSTSSVTIRLCGSHRRTDQLVNGAVAAGVILGVAAMAVAGLFGATAIQAIGLLLALAAVTALYFRPGARVSRGKDGAVNLVGVSREFRRQAGIQAHPASGTAQPLLADWLSYES